MGGNGKFIKWKFSFHRNNNNTTPSKSTTTQPPPEYICPLCGSLISDPVVVGSGHTFDRLCIQVCQEFNFVPTLADGTRPDFSTQINNLALKSAIPNWCSLNGVTPPPLEKPYDAIVKIVKALVEKEGGNDLIRPSERFLIDGVKDKPDLNVSHAVTELTHRVNRFDFNSSESSSEESVIAAASPPTPLPFTTRPACWSPYPSSSSETLNSDETLTLTRKTANFSPDLELIAKFKSSDPYEQEQGAISLRKLTRTDEEARVSLCTPLLLMSLRALMTSGYDKVETNAVAALVNLSLEKLNKIKIVRSGIVPIIIDLLKGRSVEAQEHAAGAIFSLSLEDDNKTAIGVLGALPPLLHCLIRSESERTRSDSALALYHLSLVHSNRVKLVKLGAVPVLLSVLRSSNEAITGRVVLVLYQLAASMEGKAAMLDGNAVGNLVEMIGKNEFKSESTRENCVAALYALSHGSLRFKALAKEARAVEVLKEVEENGNERAKEKARRIVTMLRGSGMNGDDEDVDWEAILESSGLSRTRNRVGGASYMVGNGKSSQF